MFELSQPSQGGSCILIRQDQLEHIVFGLLWAWWVGFVACNLQNRAMNSHSHHGEGVTSCQAAWIRQDQLEHIVFWLLWAWWVGERIATTCTLSHLSHEGSQRA